MSTTEEAPTPTNNLKLRADKLKVPYALEDPSTGKTVYQINFVTEGAAHKLSCTQSVYNKIDSNAYHRKKNLEFVLNQNSETGLVDRIDATQKKDFFHERGGMPESADITSDSGVTTAVFIIDADGMADCKVQPADTTVETIGAIREAIEAKHKTEDGIKMLDLLVGKYLVTDIREGGNHIYVDPKAK
jgi:hypothetical protein